MRATVATTLALMACGPGPAKPSSPTPTPSPVDTEVIDTDAPTPVDTDADTDGPPDTDTDVLPDTGLVDTDTVQPHSGTTQHSSPPPTPTPDTDSASPDTDSASLDTDSAAFDTDSFAPDTDSAAVDTDSAIPHSDTGFETGLFTPGGSAHTGRIGHSGRLGGSGHSGSWGGSGHTGCVGPAGGNPYADSGQPDWAVMNRYWDRETTASQHCTFTTHLCERPNGDRYHVSDRGWGYVAETRYYDETTGDLVSTLVQSDTNEFCGGRAWQAWYGPVLNDCVEVPSSRVFLGICDASNACNSFGNPYRPDAGTYQPQGAYLDTGLFTSDTATDTSDDTGTHTAHSGDTGLQRPRLGQVCAQGWPTGEVQAHQIDARVLHGLSARTYAALAGGDLSASGEGDLVVWDDATDGYVFEGGALLNRPIRAASVPHATLLGRNSGTLSITGLGDFDGDGLDDLAIGKRGTSWRGTVQVISSPVQNPIRVAHTVLGTVDYGSVGSILSPLGDVTGDGLTDLGLSASSLDALYILTGRTAPTAGVITPSTLPAWTGPDLLRLLPVPDQNADGIRDGILVGYEHLWLVPGPLAAGGDVASALSTWSLAGAPTTVHPAYNLVLGDHDGDGQPDLLAGRWVVPLAPGITSTIAAQAVITAPDDVLVAGGVDLNGDGTHDLATARPSAGVVRTCTTNGYRQVPLSTPQGVVDVYLGPGTGPLSLRLPATSVWGDGGNSNFGRGLTARGDVTGDGVTDLVVTSRRFVHVLGACSGP